MSERSERLAEALKSVCRTGGNPNAYEQCADAVAYTVARRLERAVEVAMHTRRIHAAADEGGLWSHRAAWEAFFAVLEGKE